MVDANAPPGLNREIVVATVEAGKHILYEKGNLEAVSPSACKSTIWIS
jgi:hypothetical protein